MESSIINLAIVDDHILFRKIITEYLVKHKKLSIHIQASGFIELLDKLKSSPNGIGILLMDLFLPEISCFDALQILRSEFPDIKIIILSMNTEVHLISRLLDFGIDAYISKSDEPENLLQAIASVAENRIYRNKLMTDALYWNKERSNKKAIDNVIFNDREKKILQLLWQEKSNKEIADEIYMSVRSVEKIRMDMKEKVGVRSTIGLMKFALKFGKVKLDFFE